MRIDHISYYIYFVNFKYDVYLQYKGILLTAVCVRHMPSVGGIVILGWFRDEKHNELHG